MRKLLTVLFLLASFSPAMAVDFHFDGYADFRLIVPSNQESWQNGLLGKLRYGAEDNKPELRLAEAVGQAVVLVTPELMGLAVIRIEPEQRTFFDFLEAYLRYRPVSTTAWRWSVKAGAFFPPVSLENTELGWTSPWTLTPSAINTWVGEELRTIGLEGILEWRSEARTIAFMASIYGWNDPAGILVADRGWALHDRVTGLIDRPREPDVIAYATHVPEPLYTYEVLEIDDRPGWYAAASWDETGLGKLNLIYYNNEADPTAIRKQVAWRTDFWNVGVSTQIGNVTLLAQALTGETLIVPSKFFFSDTVFQSAYLLAGWNISENWRVAGRVDVFSNSEERPFPAGNMSEHGNALTAAVNYLPYDWLRLTAEAIRVESTRGQRTIEHLNPHAIENQIQFSARFYLP
ncbi:MAG TPA: hypothetical protein VK479_15090 [Micropepsaceae bacterium]|nr:hypothetical protein [Micropepsaceae bacterium]